MYFPNFPLFPTAVARASFAISLLIASFTANSALQAQEDGWHENDIGNVGVAGSSSSSGEVITLRGSGADVWGTADGAHFRYRQTTGDGAVVVRVTNPGTGNAWAKVGVMMRQNLTPGSRNAMVLATPGNRVGLQARSEPGAATSFLDGGWTGLPVWLVLDREGNLFRGYKSYDGENWTSLGSVTLDMPETILWGLAVSSHDNSALQVATVDNVLHLAEDGPEAPSQLQVLSRTPTSIGLTWQDNAYSETGFVIEREVGGNGWFIELPPLPANTTSYVDTGLTPNMSYSYRVKVAPESNYSNTVTVVTPADANAFPAPANFRGNTATTTSIHLVWTETTSDETGFELWRAPHGPNAPSLLATLAPNTISYNDTGLTPGTAYDYYLRAVRNGVYSEFVDRVEATEHTRTGYWSGADVGAVAPGLTYVEDGGNTVLLRAGGGDIWGNADAFRFHYRQWRGDGSITVRVRELQNTDPWAKAGVMIRPSLDSTAPNIAMVLTAGATSGLQARKTSGGATEFTPGPRKNPAYWVRLTRTGDEYKGYISPDGVTWTLVGSQTFAMGSDLLIGVVASAHSSNGTQTTAVFDSISLPGFPPPPAPPSTWTQQTWGGTTGSFWPYGPTGASVQATGGDFWGTSDSGFFASRELTGDATIKARLSNFVSANDWTKMGIMIRPAGSDAQSANVFLAVTPRHRHLLQSRATAGAQTEAQPIGPAAPVQWLKLVRTGNTFTGYYSADDEVTWIPLGSTTVVMPASVRAGLAISSHNVSAGSNAAFDLFSVE